jgi:chemotaxis methyl-accepting protein methylase
MTDVGGDEAGFRALTGKIARERGFACGSYKDQCLRRRIAVRMRATGAADYASYAAVLDRRPGEWDRLLDALTINVTKLFRNADTWDAIARTVVPVLAARDGSAIRAWSAGCSSGEEPYSLAIVAHRHAPADAAARWRILATDIDEGSLARARAAAYPEAAFAETPPAVRARYFSPEAPHVVTPDARALVRFERRDLLADPPPPGPFHLVLCRNVIIYFDRESQERLFSTFHDVLAPGGFLVLGKTETLLGPARSHFAPVDQRQRIYRKPA